MRCRKLQERRPPLKVHDTGMESGRGRGRGSNGYLVTVMDPILGGLDGLERAKPQPGTTRGSCRSDLKFPSRGHPLPSQPPHLSSMAGSCLPANAHITPSAAHTLNRLRPMSKLELAQRYWGEIRRGLVLNRKRLWVRIPPSRSKTPPGFS
jgi:hypothetical protein